MTQLSLVIRQEIDFYEHSTTYTESQRFTRTFNNLASALFANGAATVTELRILAAL